MVLVFELFADFLGLKDELVASLLALEQFQLPLCEMVASVGPELYEIRHGAASAFGKQAKSLRALVLSTCEDACFELYRKCLSE